MPVPNRLAELHPEITGWRRDFHAHPELLYDVGRTAGRVAELLRAFGCDEVVEGIGRTGVVGVIRGREPAGPTVGMRADMDALPITEASGKPYASTASGRMHACGHDGHTAMLLGAAKHLADTRRFAGTAVMIFQPAEEGGAGGRAMVQDGLMDRFGVDEVYGLHNMPGLPIGRFAIRPGPLMAAADHFTIRVEGKGAHAAKPHSGIDPVLVGSQIVSALQGVVARSVDPLESAVVSVTTFHAGTAFNIIPARAELTGTARSLTPLVRDLLERRIGEVVRNVGAAFGATATLHYARNYPVTANHPAQTDKAVEAARTIAGDGGVATDTPPVMGGEDFSFMLEARPGAFIFMGNGDSAGLHNERYDFDDDAIPFGTGYWVALAERLMPLGAA